MSSYRTRNLTRRLNEKILKLRSRQAHIVFLQVPFFVRGISGQARDSELSWGNLERRIVDV